MSSFFPASRIVLSVVVMGEVGEEGLCLLSFLPPTLL